MMITKFYEYYENLFNRFHTAMEKEFLLHFLTSVDEKSWDKPQGIGFSYFVKMEEDNIVLLDILGMERGNKTYKNFICCPIRDLYNKIESRWTKNKDYLYAMVHKILPNFWSDLCMCINQLPKINLDILEVNTPYDVKSISFRDENLLIYTYSFVKPIVYSVKRLPEEYEILRRIKKKFLDKMV